MNTISSSMDLQQFASLVAAARKRNNGSGTGSQNIASVAKKNTIDQFMKVAADTRTTGSFYSQNSLSLQKTAVHVSGTKFDAYA